MSTNLKATGQPLVKGGSATPIRATSIAQVGGWRFPGAETLARDLQNIVGTLGSLQGALSSTNQSIDKIRLTNAAGELVAAIGDFLFNGKSYTNYFSELHVGSPLQKNDPTNAVFNANTDGSVVVGQNGWLDVLDAFAKDAAWIGAQNDTLPVTGATDNGSGLIRLHVPGHTLVTGNTARVQNVGGIFQAPPPGFDPVNNANGIWTVTVPSADYVDLDKSVFVGSYTSGGVIDRVLQITSAVNNGSGLIRVETSVAHTYESADKVDIPALPGVESGVGQWLITVIDATHFDLIGSTFSGTYTGGGRCLRYFAGILAQTFAVGPSFANYLLRAFADGSLRIRNAHILLTQGTSTIDLDPSIPAITAEKEGTGKIMIDASVPSIKMYDAAGNLAITFDPNGGSTIEGVTGRLIPAGGTTGQVLAKHSDTDYDVDWEAGANIPVMVGDSGSGGVAGLVPAPAAGDAAAGKVLKADGTWYTAPSMANPMTTAGDLIVGGTSGSPTRLAAGTDNYVLTAHGAGVAPTWAASSGAGAAVYVGTSDPNGTTTDIAPHNMTATGAPTPYVTSDNFHYYADETFNSWRAFDGDLSNGHGWVGSLTWAPPCRLVIDMGSARGPINAYKIVSYYDANSAITAWSLVASNDNANWTTLDSQTGQSFYGPSGQTYTFSNTTAYRYYKVLPTANVGGGEWVGVTELYLYTMGTAFTGGADGDLYLDSSASKLYGPRNGTLWPHIVLV